MGLTKKSASLIDRALNLHFIFSVIHFFANKAKEMNPIIQYMPPAVPSSHWAMSPEVIDIAQYCYVHFLSKKYALTDKEKFPREGTFVGVVIQRPNHGLAHIVRKANYAPFVIAAFQVNGIISFVFNNSSFTLKDELENIQIALLFSVVGRESEASREEDPVNYDKFRKAAANSYEYFILENRNNNSRYDLLPINRSI